MTREEKLIADIKTLIDAEDDVHEHVLLYKGIKELVEKYEEEVKNNDGKNECPNG